MDLRTALSQSWRRRAPFALLLLALPVVTLAQAQVQATTSGPRFKTEQIEEGRTLFHRSCAQCHGRNMVNAGTTVFDLRKFPVNDADRFTSSVSNGKGSMPSFKDALAPEQITALWAYVGSRGGKEN